MSIYRRRQRRTPRPDETPAERDARYRAIIAKAHCVLDRVASDLMPITMPAPASSPAVALSDYEL